MITKINRKKKLRSIAVNLLLVILGVIFGGILQQIFKQNAPVEIEAPMQELGGAIIDEGDSNGIKVVATKIASNEFRANGVSEQAETAYMLTARVYPEDASNKVDWSVGFTNTNSTWAAGKKVTDYVAVTPSSDGSLTAVVENNAAFGEQIVVKVVSRDNIEANASCTVEYLQRTEAYSFALHGSFHYEVSTLVNKSKTASITPNFISSPYAGVYITIKKSTVYTRENTDKATFYKMQPTEAFKTAITNAGISAAGLKEYSGGENGGVSNEFFGSEWGKSLYGSSAANKNKLINAISEFRGNAYEVTVFDMEGSTELATFYVTLDATTILGQKEILRVEVDESELVF